MAKLVAPLLSFSAAGSVGPDLVVQRRARSASIGRKQIPTVQGTAAQLLTTDLYRWLGGFKKQMRATQLFGWQQYIIDGPRTHMSAVVEVNLRRLRGQSSLLPLLIVPGAGGSLPLTSLIITPFGAQLRGTWAYPEIPTGWTINGVFTQIFQNQSPYAPFVPPHVVTFRAWPNTQLARTGLTPGVEYVYYAWVSWNHPTKGLLYSASISATGVPL